MIRTAGKACQIMPSALSFLVRDSEAGLRPKSGDEDVYVIVVGMYQDNKETGPVVERVQTGVRIEKRILKVMKALAEYHDLTLGDLIEGIVLHAFDGKCPFGADNLKLI